ncbi:MAG: bifunctional precorrin-2 dehydrogenase/sirohydrochlorin ferrochelatase [Chloroflexi bacterium]|nr:bifunctional precorrin-2 dehydrogenase/sirohydrochlorin ferrochelatase [Chloroflexota bacterium]
MTTYYPMFLKIEGKRCVVVGGGEVAQRKVHILLEFGAAVTVISPELDAGLKEMAQAGQIQAMLRPYQPGDLKGAFVGVVATDDRALNHAVSEEARREGVLVNVVDDAGLSDFIVPAYLRRGDVTIAVSTSGRSPALARKIRACLEKEFGAEIAGLVEFLDEVRQELKGKGVKVSGDDWQEALDIGSLVNLLRQFDRDKARAVLVEALQQRGMTA